MNEKTALKQIKFMESHSKEMRLAAEDWTSDFRILISTIMSARTRDEKTIPVSKELFKKYPNIKKLAVAKLSDVEKIIKPINFYKTKSKNIINCSKQIIDLYNGKIPESVEELTKLSGVGSKTANVFLSEVGYDAIGVDTHVAYISKKLGWTKNKNPKKIEDDLKKLFSKEKWSVVNPVLVRFGKTHTSRKQKDKLLTEIRRIK